MTDLAASRGEESFWEEFVVAPEAAGQRLDVFLAARRPWRSRSQLVALIEARGVLVNGAPSKRSSRLREGDVVVARGVAAPPVDQDLELRDLPLELLFEDEDLVVINKPSGLAVHASSTSQRLNLQRRLELRYLVEAPDPEARPASVHRLDRDTSGVIAFARRRELVRSYSLQFERRRVAKEYVAVVEGRLTGGGVIDLALRIEDGRPVTVDPDGKPCRTEYQVVDASDTRSTVAVRIHTGRKHQIRAHLAALGHPVCNDHLYGHRGEGRLMLHARVLELEHRGAWHRFEAPTPSGWHLD